MTGLIAIREPKIKAMKAARRVRYTIQTSPMRRPTALSLSASSCRKIGGPPRQGNMTPRKQDAKCGRHMSLPAFGKLMFEPCQHHERSTSKQIEHDVQMDSVLIIAMHGSPT